MNIAIDIASDFICPWCFIGKTQLKNALVLVKKKHPDASFQINWLPYFLSPDAPSAGQPYKAFMEAKFGGVKKVAEMQTRVIDAGRDAGFEFGLEKIVFRPSTLLAHRLVYRAQSVGHRPAEVEALVDRLFAAYFQRGEDIGNILTLAGIAAECGDRKDEVIDYLSSRQGEPQVKSLFSKLGELGVSGVPFFIIQRHLAVSGAQTGEVLAAAILQAMQSTS